MELYGYHPPSITFTLKGKYKFQVGRLHRELARHSIDIEGEPSYIKKQDETTSISTSQ